MTNFIILGCNSFVLVIPTMTNFIMLGLHHATSYCLSTQRPFKTHFPRDYDIDVAHSARSCIGIPHGTTSFRLQCMFHCLLALFHRKTRCSQSNFQMNNVMYMQPIPQVHTLALHQWQQYMLSMYRWLSCLLFCWIKISVAEKISMLMYEQTYELQSIYCHFICDNLIWMGINCFGV